LIHIAALLPAALVGFQVAAIEFLFQVDWSNLKPWLWLSLVSAVVTLFLFGWAGQMRPEFRHGDIDDVTKERIQIAVRRMRLLARVRRVCAILLTVSLVIYYLLWRSPAECILSKYRLDHLSALLRAYYGTYMPHGPACV
jgi:hypothetical protein